MIHAEHRESHRHGFGAPCVISHEMVVFGPLSQLVNLVMKHLVALLEIVGVPDHQNILVRIELLSHLQLRWDIGKRFYDLRAFPLLARFSLSR